jgi:hypothetical protein
MKKPLHNILDKLGLRNLKIHSKRNLDKARTELNNMIKETENEEKRKPKKQTNEEIKLAEKFKKLYKE